MTTQLYVALNDESRPLITRDKVIVERCKSNSIGSRYVPPSVVECAEQCPNGYFWRMQPPDITGAAR